MKKLFVIVILGVFGITLSSFLIKKPTSDEIQYPEGYRMWTHIKTTLVGSASPNFKSNGGYHHIYANAIAMRGYTSGYFPDGSVLIFDVINIKEQDGSTEEAGRSRMDIMVRDSLKYASTGGWGYGEFIGDGQTQVLTPALKTQCFNCHTQTKNHVFSKFRK